MSDIFGSLMGMMGHPDPRMQLQAALGQAPGQPGGAQPMAGAPPAAGGAPGGAPPGPPSGGAPGGPGGQPAAPPTPQAYQSPPDMASMNNQLANPNLGAALMQMYQRQQATEGFNRSLALLDAGTFPGRHPERMAQLMTGQTQDPGALLGNLIQLQGYQYQQQERQQFAASAGDIATTLSAQSGVKITPQEVLAMGPDAVKTMLTQNAPTETMKNVGAAMTAWQAANPDATPQDVAQHKADLISSTIGNLDPTTKELNQERRDWHAQNPGKSDADMIAARPELADPLSFAGAKTEQGKTLAIAAENKINATNSFHTIDPVLNQAEGTIEWLNDPKNRDAVKAAIHNPILSSGVVAQWDPWTSSQVAQARIYLDQLKKELYADRFAGTKNIRSNTEANNLGSAATMLDSRNNSDDDITNELQRLQNDTYTARGNLAAAAGRVVPAKYANFVDSAFLSPKTAGGAPNPLYNGATVENDFSKMSASAADAAYEKLPSGAAFVDTDGTPKKKP